MSIDYDDPRYQKYQEIQRRVAQMSYTAEKRYIHDVEYRKLSERGNDISCVEIDGIRNLSGIDLGELTDRELAELNTHIMIDILERLGRRLTYYH